MNSWGTMLIPESLASAGDLKDTFFEPISIVPETGSYMPERIFMKVDFPAPFSPITPRISPSCICASMSRRTAFPANSIRRDRTRIRVSVFIVKDMKFIVITSNNFIYKFENF